MPSSALTALGAAGLPGATPGMEPSSLKDVPSDPQRPQTYRDMLIEEGVNSNQRVQMRK